MLSDSSARRWDSERLASVIDCGLPLERRGNTLSTPGEQDAHRAAKMNETLAFPGMRAAWARSSVRQALRGMACALIRPIRKTISSRLVGIVAPRSERQRCREMPYHSSVL